MKDESRKSKIEQLVSTCVASRFHTLKELAIGYLRYKAIRKINPQQFLEIYERNLNGEWFDDIIDNLIVQFDKSK
jgi:hypothetical protein